MEIPEEIICLIFQSNTLILSLTTKMDDAFTIVLGSKICYKNFLKPFSKILTWTGDRL